MPKVSVIVPVYNSEKYLRKCIDSLINQTIDDIEIIIVNDGSTDKSEEIINEFSKRNSNIRTFTKENGGLSDARNYGMQYALGDYIGFVDSDDYVEKEMYEKMYNVAIKNDFDIVECNFIWEYQNKSKKDYGKDYSNTNDYFLYGRVMACNKLFKKSIIKENKICFPINLQYEDIEFFYKMISKIKKTGLVKNPFYHYVQRDNSIINNQNTKTEDIFTVLNDIIMFYKENQLFENYKAQLEYLYIRFLLGSSFLRIIKIKDKKLRNQLLNKTYNELNNKFPNWRKNELLKIKNKKNIYYKTVNKFTLKIYSVIFQALE